jgi:hypothetical protein
MMTPDDRLAGFVTLIGIAVATTALTWIAWLICDLYADRPVVTKDPHTGQLYIPRSDLHVGSRTRRHRGIQ